MEVNKILAKAVQAIGNFLDTLPWRELNIFLSRIGDKSLTLDAIGAKYDITRERVRQIEKKVQTQFDKEIGQSSSFHSAIEELRRLSSPAIVRSALLSKSIFIDSKIRESNLSLLDFVLDRTTALFELGSVITPCTESLLKELLDEYLDAQPGTTDIVKCSETSDARETLNFGDPKLLEELFRHFNYTAHKGLVFRNPDKGIPSYSYEVLKHFGRDMTIEEVAEWLPIDRSMRSITNALQADGRFIRTSKDRYNLRETNRPEFSGVKEAINEALLIHGGSMPISLLVNFVSSRYDVADSSVALYASRYPFTTQNGIVSLAEEMQPLTSKYELYEVRALYRITGGLRLIQQINSEHMRGSGVSIPAYVGVHYGMLQGAKLSLNPVGNDRKRILSDTGSQLAFSSVRSTLVEAGATESDLLTIDFFDTSYKVHFVTHPQDGYDPEEYLRTYLDIDSAEPLNYAKILYALGIDGDADAQTLMKAVGIKGDPVLSKAVSDFTKTRA